jgi:parvulin-like peptidyl-prolyl isomerase
MRGRKWTVRGAVGALVLLCAAGGAIGQTASKDGKKTVAVVNGEVITMAELEAILKKDGPMAMPLPEAARKQNQQFALDALISEVLLRQFLKQNVPPIDPREVQARMSDLVAGLKRQGKTLAEFCREMNQSEKQIEEGLAAWLQWNNYARQQVNDQDVEKFYQENKDMFDKVLVRASEIMLRVPPQANEGEKSQVRAQLTDLRNKILANQIDFAQAAKQYSHGITKDEGGDLDWFPHVKGILPESFLRVAFSLKPGEISDVVESEAGMHLIKVTDRKPGEPSDFTKIKEEVRLVYIDEMKQALIAQLRKGAKVQINLP